MRVDLARPGASGWLGAISSPPDRKPQAWPQVSRAGSRRPSHAPRRRRAHAHHPEIGTRGSPGVARQVVRPVERLATCRRQLAALQDQLAQGATPLNERSALLQRIAEVAGQVNRLSALRGRLVQILLG